MVIIVHKSPEYPFKSILSPLLYPNVITEFPIFCLVLVFDISQSVNSIWLAGLFGLLQLHNVLYHSD
jgi:hypothetical protein